MRARERESGVGCGEERRRGWRCGRCIIALSSFTVVRKDFHGRILQHRGAEYRDAERSEEGGARQAWRLQKGMKSDQKQHFSHGKDLGSGHLCLLASVRF